MEQLITSLSLAEVQNSVQDELQHYSRTTCKCGEPIPQDGRLQHLCTCGMFLHRSEFTDIYIELRC